MSLGSWDPNLQPAEGSLLSRPGLLPRLIKYDLEDQLDQLDRLLSDEDKQQLSGLMKIDHEAWRAAAEPLMDQELIHLIRFFAAAENLPGWEAGADSPVIPLAKILRRRGTRLDRSLLQWLREINTNRFLPYGPL